MATYNNPHWLLSHIRNSFISTDDTGMCETVMLSDDLPKQYLKKFQTPQQQQRATIRKVGVKNNPRPPEPALSEVDFVCYPGLDQSDDEDMDLASQSFDIQMYPEIGSHRFRSNTAQKLEKMDIARRKAARTKCVNFEDQSAVGGERADLFVRKPVIEANKKNNSRLSLALINSPKQTANKFVEFSRFDGAGTSGMQTKRINVYINMLPEKERNYPMKICVLASAKILEVIGFICYRCVIQYPDIPLKSIRHYGLYMTEDNDDMEDFPPLDVREPCSKFGFSHLTLAERRPMAHITRVDYRSLSMTSEDEKAGEAAVHDVHGSGGNLACYEERMMDHNDMIDAPMYRTYKLNIIDKRFFKSEVQLGISGERIEIDQQKNSSKFWTKQKAMTYPIDCIAFCEIVERRQNKSIVRIWIKPQVSDGYLSATSKHTALAAISGSPNSPQHFNTTTGSSTSSSSSSAPPIRFKHYDFETDPTQAQRILNKMNFILDVRSSDTRREFIAAREKKQEKHGKKKN